MISSKNILKIIEELLNKGDLDLGNCVDHISDPVNRLLESCLMFERYIYKNGLGLTNIYYSVFYEMILRYVPQIPLEQFKISCNNLNGNAKDVILRNLGRGFELFPECNLAEYTKFLI